MDLWTHDSSARQDPLIVADGLSTRLGTSGLRRIVACPAMRKSYLLPSPKKPTPEIPSTLEGPSALLARFSRVGVHGRSIRSDSSSTTSPFPVRPFPKFLHPTQFNPHACTYCCVKQIMSTLAIAHAETANGVGPTWARLTQSRAQA